MFRSVHLSGNSRVGRAHSFPWATTANARNCHVLPFSRYFPSETGHILPLFLSRLSKTEYQRLSKKVRFAFSFLNFARYRVSVSTLYPCYYNVKAKHGEEVGVAVFLIYIKTDNRDWAVGHSLLPFA